MCVCVFFKLFFVKNYPLQGKKGDIERQREKLDRLHDKVKAVRKEYDS